MAAAAGGFTGFLIALLRGVAGYLIGGQRDGEFDLSTLAGARSWITTMTATTPEGGRRVLTVAPTTIPVSGAPWWCATRSPNESR